MNLAGWTEYTEENKCHPIILGTHTKQNVTEPGVVSLSVVPFLAAVTMTHCCQMALSSFQATKMLKVVYH